MATDTRIIITKSYRKHLDEQDKNMDKNTVGDNLDEQMQTEEPG